MIDLISLSSNMIW